MWAVPDWVVSRGVPLEQEWRVRVQGALRVRAHPRAKVPQGTERVAERPARQGRARPHLAEGLVRVAVLEEALRVVAQPVEQGAVRNQQGTPMGGRETQYTEAGYAAQSHRHKVLESAPPIRIVPAVSTTFVVVVRQQAPVCPSAQASVTVMERSTATNVLRMPRVRAWRKATHRACET